MNNFEMWYTKTDVEKFGMLIQNVIDKRSVNYSFPSKVLIGKLPSDNFIIFLEIEFAHTKIKQRYDFTSFIVKRAKSVASIFGHWHSDWCMINVPPTPPRNLRNWYTWLYKKKTGFWHFAICHRLHRLVRPVLFHWSKLECNQIAIITHFIFYATPMRQTNTCNYILGNIFRSFRSL